MQYDFLKQFEDRMRHVGRYVRLIQNSAQKQIWKDKGFESLDMQMNVLFTALLFIMEMSLKEEICTLDDLAAFLDSVNKDHLKRPLSYDDCRELADFIVNTVLSNEGRPMYFDAVNFSTGSTEKQHVSFIANRVEEREDGIPRISYYLTDDGYNLILSTLEIENNLKLTVYEMIFQLHLEKQSYDKAADAVKTVFNTIRIQVQRIEESMRRVRRNALDYAVSDYDALMQENLETVRETQHKLSQYRDTVRSRERELQNIDLMQRKLSAKEEENLENLRIIEGYLKRSIDEHQKVLNLHFDLKSLYDRELEQLTQFRYIQRFSLRDDVYEKLIQNPRGLEYLDDLFRPLFADSPDKIFHPAVLLEAQRPGRRSRREEEEVILESGDDEWVEEQKEKLLRKKKKYEDSVRTILRIVMEQTEKEMDLAALSEELAKHPRRKKLCIPSVNIFKEVLIEMVRHQRLEPGRLQKEREEYIEDDPLHFHLGDTLLDLREDIKGLAAFEAYRVEDGKTVCFTEIEDEDGSRKCLRCSNVLLRVTME